ncbi:MAG: YdcF family protein [Snodgrassella sp.]|nr:YdcF family protein [Snodgrassella sp.]
MIAFVLIMHLGKEQTTSDINQISQRQVGLVLGTSRYLRNGQLNPFYLYRIQGAVRLFKEGKVQHLLLSGDHSKKNYNEPQTMQQDLLKAGIPASAMTLDYAGLRTLDSIARANKIFKLNEFTIITQQFHCERAVFIANKYHLTTQCYAVASPSGKNYIKVITREFLARIKSIIDLYIINKQPRFTGDPEPINTEDSTLR